MTTGMSAPPIASTMCRPKTNASPVIISSGHVPAIGESAPTNTMPNQIQAKPIARLIRCRPGSVRGRLLRIPWSFPNAATEPVNVTAPIRTPRKTSMS